MLPWQNGVVVTKTVWPESQRCLLSGALPKQLPDLRLIYVVPREQVVLFHSTCFCQACCAGMGVPACPLASEFSLCSIDGLTVPACLLFLFVCFLLLSHLTLTTHYSKTYDYLYFTPKKIEV